MTEVQTIRTARFVLRPLRRADAAALFSTLADDEQCRFLTRPPFVSEDELWDWLAEPGWPGLTWIAEDASGEVVARLVAVPGKEDGVVEIGYITCSHRQGEGIARECSAALVEHLFAQGTRKITAEVDAENTASISLLERLGFTKEAHLREHETTHAGLRDVLWYGLLRPEWPAGAR